MHGKGDPLPVGLIWPTIACIDEHFDPYDIVLTYGDIIRKKVINFSAFTAM